MRLLSARTWADLMDVFTLREELPPERRQALRGSMANPRSWACAFRPPGASPTATVPSVMGLTVPLSFGPAGMFLVGTTLNLGAIPARPPLSAIAAVALRSLPACATEHGKGRRGLPRRAASLTPSAGARRLGVRVEWARAWWVSACRGNTLPGKGVAPHRLRSLHHEQPSETAIAASASP